MAAFGGDVVFIGLLVALIEYRKAEKEGVMFLELNRRDRDMLLELVESKLAETDSRLREGPSTSSQPLLREMQRHLQHIVHRIHEAEWDVTC